MEQRPLMVQRLEDRRLLAAVPLGATVSDTGEFLLGTVGVVPIFFESDGTIDPQTQNWSAAEIDATLAKIEEGVNWWSEALAELNTVHTLDFVVDDTYARQPVDTPYEPIDRISNDFRLYAGGFLSDLGYGDSPSFEAAVHRFNHDQRLRLGTDWAFSIFVVDNSDDPGGQFATGGSFSDAFAFPGGLFIVLPSSRPASTVAHEMGHIFWARDEYPGGGSWTDTRGYYDAQNWNAADNSTPGFVQERSIMRSGEPLKDAYEARISPASTYAMIGWRDTDGNGIFDVADVPLALDAVGYFDPATETYHFRGSASAVPLRNQNSSGPQSDITLNRISRLEYSIDEGDWITAASPDAQAVELEVAVPIAAPFSSIRWRVVDDAVGVTSPIVAGSAAAVASSSAAASGYAFLDENDNGERDGLESLLPEATITIRHADGSLLAAGEVVAAQLGEGELDSAVAGMSLSSDGIVLDGRVSVRPSPSDADQLVFQAFNQQQQRWEAAWSGRVKLIGELQHPTGQVVVDFASSGSLGYGRVEAYDSDGNLITRVTSSAIEAGEQASVTVSDPRGRIATVRAFGHAGTRVAIESIRHGIPTTLVTDASGAWSFPNLADGSYRIDVTPQWAVQAFEQNSFVIEVTEGASPRLVAVAQRVSSPRHNQSLAADVNGDGDVTALDALLVINDLSRHEARMLTYAEREGAWIDVNDDGSVSAMDALLVINSLNRSGGGGEGEVAAEQPVTTDLEIASRSTTRAIATPMPTDPALPADSTRGVDAVLADWPATQPSPLASVRRSPSQDLRNGQSLWTSSVFSTHLADQAAQPGQVFLWENLELFLSSKL